MTNEEKENIRDEINMRLDDFADHHIKIMFFLTFLFTLFCLCVLVFWYGLGIFLIVSKKTGLIIVGIIMILAVPSFLATVSAYSKM